MFFWVTVSLDCSIWLYIWEKKRNESIILFFFWIYSWISDTSVAFCEIGQFPLNFFCDLHEKFLLEKYVVLVLKSPVLKFQFQKFSSKSHSSCFKVTFLFF